MSKPHLDIMYGLAMPTEYFIVFRILVESVDLVFVFLQRYDHTRSTGGWDVNGPPVRLPPGETILSRRNDAAAMSNDAFSRRESEINNVGEDTVLATESSHVVASGGSVDATKALTCRQSVLDYVINATDAKDECDGLTKAFQKTCGETAARAAHQYRQSSVLHGQAKRQQRKQQRQRKNPPNGVRSSHSSRRLPHRKLHDKLRKRFEWRLYNFCQTWQERIHRLFTSPDPLPFFAEDAVSGKAWNDALYIVDNHLVDEFYRDVIGGTTFRRRLEDDEDELEPDIVSDEIDKVATNETKIEDTIPKPLTLDLPKAIEPLSETTLNIVNLGNQDGTDANDPMDDPNNVKPHVKPVEDPLDPNSPEGRACCVSILKVYQQNCSTEPESEVSDKRLFFVVFVMAFCGMVKSLIRSSRLLWLPEAAGCILVGGTLQIVNSRPALWRSFLHVNLDAKVLSGYILILFPHQDISFDGNWFLRILVPPIIFEAALGIDKRSFNRHIVPILLYAVAGTLIASFLTAVIVHKGTIMLSQYFLCPVIPFVEALTYGSLISSIDPIAVLSVLSNMGMVDTDTIYVVIFGESLLNDGVAIVLFHTIVHFLDSKLVIDSEALTDAALHFFVVAFGSLLIGCASGMMATVYYWSFYQCQTPLVEVLMFFCWALLPYYVCDGIEWSGIVAAVATGFVMDLYIVGQRKSDELLNNESEESAVAEVVLSGDARRGRRPIFHRKGHLSEVSKTHIGFVAQLIATTMETAIFAYLGFFLFSHRYHWNVWHILLAIMACCLSRAIMIPSLSLVANWITRLRQIHATCRVQRPPHHSNSRADTSNVGVCIDRRMQIALWFAGLRGAMSFALVENIPLYDSETGEGTRLKPELKAMTSASIVFTVFVLGGSTYYMMEYLGVAPTLQRKKSFPQHEMIELINASTDGAPPSHRVQDSLLSGNQLAFRRTRPVKTVDVS